uniref:Uncharacterized protein n=1 Tax=Utricularia reniformis TaxID=192314 RepID=A0A1Y0AZI2_9LAMI|nr:hypothetical protein AEK19_MT0261 [Utricularia reniformis]ART30538.1 hypothetical protein AEK19_MT0261 [Utricularia reniformis]
MESICEMYGTLALPIYWLVRTYELGWKGMLKMKATPTIYPGVDEILFILQLARRD